MKRIAISLFSLVALASVSRAQISGPTTVTAGQSATWTISNAPILNNYTWAPNGMNHEPKVTATTVTGGKLGANQSITVPDYPSMWNDNGKWYAFAVSRGVTPSTDGTLYRLELGGDPTPNNTSTSNQVTAFNLTTLGLPSSRTSHGGSGNVELVHTMVYNPDTKEWHLFWFRTGYNTGTTVTDANNLFRIYRLDFGTSLANTPSKAEPIVVPTTTDYAGGAGIKANAQVAQSKFIRTEKGEFILFIGSRWPDGIIRVNFGKDITNKNPKFDMLPNVVTAGTGVGSLVSRNSALDVVQVEGKWFLFCSTTDANGTAGNELWRFDFGADPSSNPSAIVGLGGLPGFNHWGLQIIPAHCGKEIYGFINGRGTIYRLDFKGDITSVPTAETVGTPGSGGLPAANDNSGFFAYVFKDSMYAIMGGASNNGLYSMRLPVTFNNYSPVHKVPGDNSFTYTYNTPGTYNLTAAVNTFGGGSRIYCHQVTVVPGGLPQPGNYTVAPRNVCVDQKNVTYTIPAVSGATAYHWFYTGSNVTYSASTTTPSNQLSFQANSTNGTLRVWAVAGTDSSISSRDVDIVVVPLPVVSISPASSTICAGASATLTASGAASYAWAHGGNAAATSVSPATTTTYTVTGTTNGCSTSVSRVVNVNPLPTINISPATATICVGESIQLTASGANTYSWSPSGGTGAAATVSPTTTTAYTVEGTNTATGCKNSATRQVVVNPLPVSQATAVGGITEVCNGDSVVLNASGIGYNYSWRNGSGATVGSGQNYAAKTTGSYKAVVTDPATGCIDETQEVDVTVYDRPVVSLDQADTAFCDGGILTLTVNTNDTDLNFRWQKDAADIAQASADFLEIDQTGDYQVIVGRNGVASCESTTNVVNVTVHPLPVVNITWDGIILHATPGYASYQWYQAGQAIPGGTDSTFQPGSNGGYNVVVVDANGCEGTSPVMNLTDVGKASVADLKAGRAVQIYPNPTTGIIYINAPVAVDAEIYGSDGRVLNRFVASSQLDLSHYPTGVYMIRIMAEDGSVLYTGRVLKN